MNMTICLLTGFHDAYGVRWYMMVGVLSIIAHLPGFGASGHPDFRAGGAHAVGGVAAQDGSLAKRLSIALVVLSLLFAAACPASAGTPSRRF
jgi:hypothetical protein